MKCLFLIFTLLVSNINAQFQKVLVIGNYESVCIKSDSLIHFEFSEKLPETLFEFGAIFIFSGTISNLKSQDIDAIIDFAESGKGVYCGAENQPFQKEFNQISNRLFAQEAWGNFTNNDAELAEKSLIYNSESKKMNAGQTTVAVPFNSLIKVEAWLDDQPIITSYKIGKGKILFDGGYSRFYCEQFDINEIVFTSILQFLLFK